MKNCDHFMAPMMAYKAVSVKNSKTSQNQPRDAPTSYAAGQKKAKNTIDTPVGVLYTPKRV
jgi:hypothetical protein